MQPASACSARLKRAVSEVLGADRPARRGRPGPAVHAGTESTPHSHRTAQSALEEHVMKAAVVRSFGQPLVIEERPDPEPGPGRQVRIRVEASGLCRDPAPAHRQRLHRRSPRRTDQGPHRLRDVTRSHEPPAGFSARGKTRPRQLSGRIVRGERTGHRGRWPTGRVRAGPAATSPRGLQPRRRAARRRSNALLGQGRRLLSSAGVTGAEGPSGRQRRAGPALGGLPEKRAGVQAASVCVTLFQSSERVFALSLPWRCWRVDQALASWL